VDGGRREDLRLDSAWPRVRAHSLTRARPPCDVDVDIKAASVVVCKETTDVCTNVVVKASNVNRK
jgi:hypothetical protein